MPETVSVIIPTYNRRAVLGRALDSVLAQTRPADEIIVVDDGSSDGTVDYVRQQYPDVHCEVQDNQGVSAARNTGIDKAEGDWIALLDSDDAWLPDKLDRQLTALGQQPDTPLVHCDEIWIRNGVRVNPMRKHAKSGGDIFLNCLPLCAISPSAALLHRQRLQELGGFDESLPACEDYDLWLRLCSQDSVLYVDEQLVLKYGGHRDQLSRAHWGMDRFRVRALSKLLRSQSLQDKQKAAVRKTLKEKIRILRLGAVKRDNQALLRDLDKVIARHDLKLESVL